MTIRGRKLLEALLQAVEGGSPFTQEIIVKSRHLFEDGTLLARPTGSLERIQMIPSPSPTLANAKMKQSCSRMDTIFRHFFELSWKSNKFEQLNRIVFETKIRFQAKFVKILNRTLQYEV